MAGGALPGFRDFYPDEFAHRAHIFRAWREVARRFAFVEYDGPPLEPLDLYTKKSGEEIVGQLYNFEDKGGRQVALRPEMTPTFARMVAERANALRKPVRWFSIPQLFRYERAQRGRLREHFQLNVDIVGEASEVADAELLAVAIGIMQELGLTAQDVRARVSDRRLLNAILGAIGVGGDAIGAAYAMLDKTGRQPEAVAREKLAAAGLPPAAVDAVVGLTTAGALDRVRAAHGGNPDVAAALARLDAYLSHARALGIGDWIDVDLSIVRGLAYYTGIVFELFDAKGELRAICGGGRYDNLLKDLGGVDLPALGFGMGDVVLGELLKDRGLMPAAAQAPEFYVVAGPEATVARVLAVAAALRELGAAVDYPISAEKLTTQRTNAQLQAAQKSGAAYGVVVRGDAVADVRLLTLDRSGNVPLDIAALCSGNVQLAEKALREFRKRADDKRLSVPTTETPG
ncbi:MAG TPA: histidine--tRNA ligase [Gemmatimonadaceae bacterium]|nr:histidine--tRNA ligase [Gemmatimonadaceae bacterium]